MTLAGTVKSTVLGIQRIIHSLAWTAEDASWWEVTFLLRPEG